jgi:peptide/nickel transport system substrate-binding protein
MALIASACGDDGDGGDASGTTGGSGATTTVAKTPVAGGTLVFGQYSEPRGLDPIVSTGSGVTGAIEMAAVYDTLLRYDPPTKKYENRMAESVTANADSTEWTIKIKPGIKFTDGTDYNAEAVRFGMNRHRVGTSIPAAQCAEWVACPSNTTSSNVYMALVRDIAVVDALTLKVTLSEPWTAFQYALAAEPAMIPSPTALKKCDATKPPAQCDFNLKPIGAGAFTVESFKTKDSINMVKNPNYVGGTVYLDGLKFVNLGDVGGIKTWDALKSGTLNVAFLRGPESIALAREAKYQGFTTMQNAGGIALMNMGVNVTCNDGKPEPTCAGKPNGPTQTNPATKNVKVRQAVAAAVNPQTIIDRGYSGKGPASTALFDPSFPWDPKVPGPKYDVELAKKLVAEAKAEGWDGKIRLLYNNSPTAMAIGQTMQAALQGVGMTVELDTSKDTTAQITQVVSLRDFDVATWGLAAGPDESAMAAFAQNLSSTSISNRVGFRSDKVDAALKAIRSAKSDAEKTAAYKVIAEEYNAQLPWYTFAPIEEFITWSPKVNGMTVMGRGSVLLDKAWIEK